jgi:hypothetical protein
MRHRHSHQHAATGDAALTAFARAMSRASALRANVGGSVPSCDVERVCSENWSARKLTAELRRYDTLHAADCNSTATGAAPTASD